MSFHAPHISVFPCVKMQGPVDSPTCMSFALVQRLTLARCHRRGLLRASPQLMWSGHLAGGGRPVYLPASMPGAIGINMGRLHQILTDCKLRTLSGLHESSRWGASPTCTPRRQPRRPGTGLPGAEDEMRRATVRLAREQWPREAR